MVQESPHDYLLAQEPSTGSLNWYQLNMGSSSSEEKRKSSVLVLDANWIIGNNETNWDSASTAASWLHKNLKRELHARHSGQ